MPKKEEEVDLDHVIVIGYRLPFECFLGFEHPRQSMRMSKLSIRGLDAGKLLRDICSAGEASVPKRSQSVDAFYPPTILTALAVNRLPASPTGVTGECDVRHRAPSRTHEMMQA
jgi:hypothetical protein